jgi:ABC-type branched-subunit amino acid transport system ATPase component
MVLEVRGLRKAFGGLVAVDGVSFQLHSGEVTALIGPNGSGKTTILDVITGLLKPTGGDVLLDGRSLRGLPCRDVFRSGVVRTFQDIRIIRDMSVTENVMLVHRYSGMGEGLLLAIAGRRYINETEGIVRMKARHCLDRVGLGTKEGALAGTLSHGQRKLLELARAISTGATVLLLDEPTAGVFPDTRRVIHDLISQIALEGRAVLFIEHDMRFVCSVADRVVALDCGHKIAEGRPDVVLADKGVVAAFLGARRVVPGQ